MLHLYGLRLHWAQQLEHVRYFSFRRYRLRGNAPRANLLGVTSARGKKVSHVPSALCISPPLPFNALECCSRAWLQRRLASGR